MAFPSQTSDVIPTRKPAMQWITALPDGGARLTPAAHKNKARTHWEADVRNEALLRKLRDDMNRVGAKRADVPTLPFGLDPVDSTLPGGGLALASLHEVAGGAAGAVHGAAAILFAAGIAARTTG